MKIALLGYGRMGKTIEGIAKDRGHEICLKIGSSNTEEINKLQELSADIAIDFSLPEIAPKLIKACFDAGVPVVSGTTGWLDQLEDVEAYCKEKSSAFIYASNFSIGVNLFFHLNKLLAKTMSKVNGYQASMEEIHHIHKKDAPSGTAITLADEIIKQDSRYKSWSLDSEKENSISINAKRINEVPGTHSIKYESEVDQIEICHEAKNRKGFAEGSVVAAEWLHGKTGIYSMNDVLEITP